MADILIRGMEMPKNCMECPFVICLNTKDNCPLVPLPEGHGRLIDADELDECYRFSEQEKYDSFAVPIGVIRQNIKDAATIVSVEGGGEND